MENTLAYKKELTDEPKNASQVAFRAPRDLREWLEKAEALKQVRRVTAEVDWNQEMSAATYMYHQRIGAPAVLFENIKGYKGGRSLWNVIGSSTDRMALGLGLPTGLKPLDLARLARDQFSRRIPPRYVQPEEAPIYENHLTGADIDLLRFPIPKHWPRDGGRYAGTGDMVITRDPEAGWLNAGTYRMQIQGRDTVGLYLSPGKDARLHIERSWQMGRAAEVVACWGIAPAWFIVACQTVPKNQSELEFIGGLHGEPLEVVKGTTSSLPVPARAEVAIEGIIRPDSTKDEGPFGEYSGYYGRPEGPAFLVEVTAVHYRNNPILTNSLMADYPANECGLVFGLGRSGRVWNDLESLGVPGIKGVWANPAAAGGTGMIVISLEQRYAGHAPQVLALAAQCPGGAYCSKWIVAVDEDVDPSNMNQVLWAMTTRCDPAADIDILRQTWSTWLDPARNPPELRPYASKALINACKEHRYLKVFSPRTKIARSMYEQVSRRWKELGFEGDPPDLWALEEGE